MHEATNLLVQSWLDTCRASVEATKVFLQIAAIRKSAWCRHSRERAEITGNHQHPRCGRRENQLGAPCGSLYGELLSDRATPGNAHDMHALVPEYVQQLRGEPRQHPQPIRQVWRRGFASTRNSKTMTFRSGSSIWTKGPSSSKRDPIPLKIRSGTLVGFPGHKPTRSSWPAILMR